MKSIFSLAGGLLVLDGILHLVKVFVYPIDMKAIIPVILVGLFGIVYLTIGYFLLRRRDAAVLWGFLAPLVGLLLTLLGMQPNPDPFTIMFIVLDVLVIILCGYIYFAGRGLLKRLS